ncbi:hypothetical protein AGABI1DRAFT_78624 [Agaricus bisporus var. burnettii JB137-S8]|uniref:FAD dependent oxidoreductase domain-containing protein n=1 Tax=Agaricus bisporus var. burnettii (strain JB137-S8 / ATCC MYA-4627 / FGSC 10392) TaxID=597362 RepID=K5XP79_AGABU|nr:uncharacterized protein AGABI1DRAFT_78624 [Agaricus bisporus var. burnettii JB137-S8]EKM76500.1 hypothetical protein AGABI1DRAFT_78624 [Agaricus bisporus var. burnettii JB137-S8]
MADIQDQQVEKKEIVVVGAGVIGLTTAIALQEKGQYRVTIIADAFPGDQRSTRYTSCWAGAHHVTLSGKDVRIQQIDKDTFDYMWQLSEPGKGPAEGCFLRLKQEELYEDGHGNGNVLDFYPDCKDIPNDNLLAGVTRGVEFQTLTIDVPIYLQYLKARFLARGGSVIRSTVQHINQILEGGPYVFHEDYLKRNRLARKVRVDGLVICAGLGARTLGGIEDPAVYPIRGQTVILRAPWVKSGRTLTGKHWVYIIPRRSGDVVVGGIEGVNDWYPLPRPETRTDILRRGLALYPELAPPEVRRAREPNIEDLLPLVIEDACGFRPARKGGLRLEAQRVRAEDGRSVPLIFNYGHAGHGYISSWGCAFSVLEMLTKEL